MAYLNLIYKLLYDSYFVLEINNHFLVKQSFFFNIVVNFPFILPPLSIHIITLCPVNQPFILSLPVLFYYIVPFFLFPLFPLSYLYQSPSLSQTLIHSISTSPFQPQLSLKKTTLSILSFPISSTQSPSSVTISTFLSNLSPPVSSLSSNQYQR